MSDSKAVLSGAKRIRAKVGTAEPEIWKKVVTAQNAIETSLLNNFDTPSAVIILMDFIGEFNRNSEVSIHFQPLE